MKFDILHLMGRRYLILRESESSLPLTRALLAGNYFHRIFVQRQKEGPAWGGLFDHYPKLSFVTAIDDNFRRLHFEASDEVVYQSENLPAEQATPLLLTAADKKYAGWLEQLATSTARFNYPLEVYDLGGLGYGTPYAPPLPLREDGSYLVAEGIWESRALHKPAIVLDCLRRVGAFTIYCDADIHLRGTVDELAGDYDVGVTVRPTSETKPIARGPKFPYSGYVNAGLVCFNNTPAALRFVEKWIRLTADLQNDQMALNRLINPSYFPLFPDRTFVESGVRIRTFPGEVYNFSFRLDSRLRGEEKVLHFKSKPDRFLNFQHAEPCDLDQWLPCAKAEIQRLAEFAPVRSQYPGVVTLWDRIVASHQRVHQTSVGRAQEIEKEMERFQASICWKLLTPVRWLERRYWFLQAAFRSWRRRTV